MSTLQETVDAVQAQSGKVASMAAFVAGMEQQLRDALSGATLPPSVQAAVDAVFAGVGANSQAISDAIDGDPNTPAPIVVEPDPTPDPDPVPVDPNAPVDPSAPMSRRGGAHRS